MLSRVCNLYVWIIGITLFAGSSVCNAGLQEDINNASPGDTIVIADGIYDTCLVIDKSITLKGSSADKVLISPKDKNGSGSIITVKPDCEVIISGISIKNIADSSGVFNYKQCFDATNGKIKINSSKMCGGSNVILLANCESYIDNCQISDATYCGIVLASGNLKVQKSSADNCAKCGICCTLASNIKNKKEKYYEIDECNLSKNKVGIEVYSGFKGAISNCTIIDNANAGIAFITVSSECVVKSNRIMNNENSGISVNLNAKKADADIQIVENEITNNGSGVAVSGIGNGVKIIGNSCTKNKKAGIYVTDDSCAIVSKNKCLENECGIIFYSKRESVAEENVCAKNIEHGIWVVNSSAVVKNNVCNENTNCGISVRKAEADIFGNELNANAKYGVHIENNVYAKIHGNTASKNTYGYVVTDKYSTLFYEDNKGEDNSEGLMSGDFKSKRVSNYFLEKDFSYLENEIKKIRKSEIKRMYDGNAINDYYEEIFCLYEVSTKYKKIFTERLSQWKEAMPESVTPCILEAMVNRAIAWEIRGCDYADNVKEENWPKYREYINKAIDCLRNAEHLCQDDPHLYSVMYDLANSISDGKLMNEAFYKGVKVNKYYFRLYSAMAWSLAPRWHGSYKRSRIFFDQAVSLTEDKFGKSMYSAIISWLLYQVGKDEVEKYNYSYKKLAASFEDLMKQYPNGTWAMNRYCYFAYKNKDKVKARELIGKIGDNWDSDVWNGTDDFEKIKAELLAAE